MCSGEATLGVVDSAVSERGVGIMSAACVRIYSVGSQDGSSEQGHALARVLEGGNGWGRGEVRNCVDSVVTVGVNASASEILVFGLKVVLDLFSHTHCVTTLTCDFIAALQLAILYRSPPKFPLLPVCDPPNGSPPHRVCASSTKPRSPAAPTRPSRARHSPEPLS